MRSNPSIQRKTIVWAVDAFEAPGDLLQSAVRTLILLGPKFQAQIQPVFILTPWQLNLVTEFGELSEEPGMEFYRRAAEASLNELLQGLAIPGLLDPIVITVNSTSTQSAIEALSNCAELTDAEAILVSSHGRSGLGRLFLGSFSERLLLFSKRPVIVVHGSRTELQEFNRILAPTDLTEAGKADFESTLDLAKRFKLEVILFHSLPHPIEPVVQSGVFLLGGGWMPISEYVTTEAEKRMKKLDEWVAEGKRRGVSVRSILNTEGVGTAQSILDTARRENVGMITMGVHTGAIAAVFVGSVTREVVRASDYPVWVFRTKLQTQRKKQDEAAA